MVEGHSAAEPLAPLRVLHVSPYFFPAHVYGGPIQSTYRLCVASAQLGCDIRVLTTNANGTQRVLALPTTRAVTLEGGVQVRYCARVGQHSASPSLLAGLGPAVRWAEVVHLQAVYSFPTLPTLLACRLLGRPLVWSPRGALQRWTGTTRARAKAVWEQASRLVAPARLRLHVTSEDEAEASQRRLPNVRTQVIPNGMDVPAQVEHVPGDGVLRLLFLGRLHPIKALENLLDACQLLDQRGVVWQLTVAGTGEPAYQERLCERARQAGLAGRVRWAGQVSDAAKPGLFAETDVLVLPSHTENFGMVVAEALGHAVPVIASRGTPWARLEEIGCGLWTDNSAAALAAAVDRLRRMPRREMGARGRAWIAREFGWDSVARSMLALYHEVRADAA